MKFRFIRRAPFERALCAAGALICYTAAAILTPSGARSELTPAGVKSPAPDSTVADAPVEPVTPARDAFEPRVAMPSDSPVQEVRLLPTPPPSLKPSARLASPAGTPRAARVTAIVTGQVPSAIIEVDGAPQAVGVGDRAAGARIIAIDASGIELDTGVRLPLSPGAP